MVAVRSGKHPKAGYVSAEVGEGPQLLALGLNCFEPPTLHVCSGGKESARTRLTPDMRLA